MSAAARPHVGDVGTKVRYQFVKASDGLPLDISSAVVFSLTFFKPKSAAVVKTNTDGVTLFSGGTTGKIEFTVPATSIWTEAGLWHVQGYVEVGTFKAKGARDLVEVLA